MSSIRTAALTTIVAALISVPLAAGTAAAAPHTQAQRASVSYLRSSATSLDSHGGPVTFATSVTHGDRCRFALSGVAPATPAVTRVVACKPNATLTVNIPANATAAPAKWRVSVTALGHGRYLASAPRSITVSVAAASQIAPPTGGPGTLPPPPAARA